MTKIIVVYLIASFMWVSCSKENEIQITPMDEIISPKLQTQLSLKMPIYKDNTPPNVEGTYLCSPVYLIYSSIKEDEDSYEEEGNFMDIELTYSTQSSVENKLVGLIQQVNEGDVYSTSNSEGKTYIYGSNNNFTICDPMIKTDKNGKSIKELFIISGTKTESGISNLYISLLMTEKPEEAVDIINVNDYRIFKDGDGLATNSSLTKSEDIRTLHSSQIKKKNRRLLELHKLK